MRLLLTLSGIVTILSLTAMGVYLVVTEHYGWAWIPFLMACSVTVRSGSDEKPDAKPVIERVVSHD